MKPKNPDFVVTFLTLRQMIGWVGLVMPLFVRLGAWWFEGITTSSSISAYYYTGMRDVFVGTLVVGGALLACYRTPAFQDAVVATVAGLAAIGIGLFPMAPSFAKEILDRFPEMDQAKCYVNRGFLGFHFVFVAIFFALTFYLVYFRFTALTPPNPSWQRTQRNRIYKICGLAMLAAFSAIGILALEREGRSIFWPETVAIVAFGSAWLVKGQTILKDV